MEKEKGTRDAGGGQKKPCGLKTDDYDDSSHPRLNKVGDSKFSLPVEPTESVDKHQEYPPIVTADGEVDTDIDHLMVNPEDDYVDLPVQEIPSKFPKPRVVTVIEGSLDDDIDNLMNHDGTMTHTLLDAPKNFQPGDLKEINANKEGKKHHRSYHKMDGVEAEEGFAIKNYEVVPAKEQNNSSEKYPEDESLYPNEKEGSGVGVGDIKLFSGTDNSVGSGPPDSAKVEDLAPVLPNEEAPLSTDKGSEFSWPGGSPGGDSYLIKIINDDCAAAQCDSTISKEEKLPLCQTNTIAEKKVNINDGCFNRSGEDLEAKVNDSKDISTMGKNLEKEPNSKIKSGQIDTELIEDLTIICTDAITKLAMVEKGLGHLEQQQQLLAIANVLKHRIPVRKRSKRFNPQHIELSSNEMDAAKENMDDLSCDTSIDLNTQAKIMVQNLLKQVAVIENAGIISSVEKPNILCNATQENETENDNSEDQFKQSLALRNQGRKQLLSSRDIISKECGSTQTSQMNLSENPSISAALKVAGDSMTAAAKIAEALSLLIKSTGKNECQMETNHKSVKSREIKEHLGKGRSRSTPGRKHHNDTGNYQTYNVMANPSFESCSARSLRVEDASSVDDIGSRIMYHSRGVRRQSIEVYHPLLPNSICPGEKTVKEECSDLSTGGRKRHGHRRRSKSCKEDGTLCLELQHVLPTTKLHHSRHSDNRCNEGRDILPKEDGLGINYMNPKANSENWHTKDGKRRILSRDKHNTLDLTKLQEKDGRQRVLRCPEDLRQSRDKKSSKSEKRNVDYTCDSSMKETSKHHRHKEANSLHVSNTNPSSEKNGTHEKKKERTLRLFANEQNVPKESAARDKQVNLEISQSADNPLPQDSQVISHEEYKDGGALRMEKNEDVSMDIVACDSPTIDETWSLPTRCASPCDSYFDRVVWGLKPWAPPSENSTNKTSTAYIRSKLVGSVVDPDTRDSDFDSIEFNANARVNFSKMVRFKDGYDWSWEEEPEWQSDSSSTDCIPSCSRWHCEF